MADIRKGKVTKVLYGGTHAVIRPFGWGETETPELPVQRVTVKIPAHTGQGSEGSVSIPAQTVVALHPIVAINDIVAFVLYEDGTGLIIDKF